MKYDIYFHNDLDGRASAAMMLAFLRGRGDGIARYVAVTYGDATEKNWNDPGLLNGKNPAIIVDFQYHPAAAWWFDHHETGIKNAAWRRRFRPDTQHRLAPRYRSCAHLVYDSLMRDFGWKPPRHFAKLATWLDLIDGAGYSSAKQTIEMRDPALLVNAFIEALPHTEQENRRFIRLLSEKPLAAAIRVPWVARPIRALKSKVRASLAFYKKNTALHGRVTFVDVTHDPLSGLLRFAPSSFYPRAVYGMRMEQRGKWWYLGVGVNPWFRRKNKKNLGAIMRRYGGGGHAGVAGAEFPGKEAALRAFGKIERELNRG